MIFVNSGAGGYWFLNHAVWNGLNVADCVFPWFMFIMGVAIHISMRSVTKKNLSKNRLMLGILRRTALLFLFGLIINSTNYREYRFTLAYWFCLRKCFCRTDWRAATVFRAGSFQFCVFHRCYHWTSLRCPDIWCASGYALSIPSGYPAILANCSYQYMFSFDAAALHIYVESTWLSTVSNVKGSRRSFPSLQEMQTVTPYLLPPLRPVLSLSRLSRSISKNLGVVSSQRFFEKRPCEPVREYTVTRYPSGLV